MSDLQSPPPPMIKCGHEPSFSKLPPPFTTLIRKHPQITASKALDRSIPRCKLCDFILAQTRADEAEYPPPTYTSVTDGLEKQIKLAEEFVADGVRKSELEEELPDMKRRLELAIIARDKQKLYAWKEHWGVWGLEDGPEMEEELVVVTPGVIDLSEIKEEEPVVKTNGKHPKKRKAAEDPAKKKSMSTKKRKTNEDNVVEKEDDAEVTALRKIKPLRPRKAKQVESEEKKVKPKKNKAKNTETVESATPSKKRKAKEVDSTEQAVPTSKRRKADEAHPAETTVPTPKKKRVKEVPPVKVADDDFDIDIDF